MKTARLIGAVALCSTAVACSSEGSSDPKQKYAEYAESKVRDIMKDPDSTQFKDVKGYPSQKVACGQVNSKNAMGGYVGFGEFSFYEGGVHLQNDDFKAFIMGARKCTIADAEDNISETKASDLTKDQKAKYIAMFQKVIDDTKREPPF